MSGKPSQDCPYCMNGTMEYAGSGRVKCDNCGRTRLC